MIRRPAGRAFEITINRGARRDRRDNAESGARARENADAGRVRVRSRSRLTAEHAETAETTPRAALLHTKRRARDRPAERAWRRQRAGKRNAHHLRSLRFP